MNDNWIPAISPADRSVPPVELRRLTPHEREEDRQRRQRRRRKAEDRPEDTPGDGKPGIDVRV